MHVQEKESLLLGTQWIHAEDVHPSHMNMFPVFPKIICVSCHNAEFNILTNEDD